jgi:hypothetical protein
MARQIDNKLKYLVDEVPPGFLVDTPWLAAHHIDRKLAYWYVKHGWLDKVTQGVYRRPFSQNENETAKTGWKTTLLSMQWLMKYDVHLGGRSALGLQGFTHYLQFSGPETVMLYGNTPTWLKRLPAPYKFVTRNRTLFGGKKTGIEDAFHSQTHETQTQETENENIGLNPWRWPLMASTPERAILELLKEVPKRESFHMVDTVFEGLANLRPAQLKSLLKLCRSVKVKRLFFVFADRHNHAWRKYLNAQDFDLGSGPRALIDDGKIHPLYNITVPPEYMPTPDMEPTDGP